MIKSRNRFIDVDSVDAPEPDYNQVTFIQDNRMVEYVANNWVNMMTQQMDAVEFETLKDLETNYETERAEG